MSRIGKAPVTIPKGVKTTLAGGMLTVEGPLGKLEHRVHPAVGLSIDPAVVTVTRSSDNRLSRSIHGLTRALIANMVEGVSKGYEKKLEINGVGYEAAIEGKILVLKLGFNRPVRFPLPTTVTIEAPTPTSLLIKGIDNQQVGSVAAAIRKLRKPEPYKGKGIKYSDEVIRRKAGKAFASGGGG
jgi:large subunit ribosomal protein L6